MHRKKRNRDPWTYLQEWRDEVWESYDPDRRHFLEQQVRELVKTHGILPVNDLELHSGIDKWALLILIERLVRAGKICARNRRARTSLRRVRPRSLRERGGLMRSILLTLTLASFLFLTFGCNRAQRDPALFELLSANINAMENRISALSSRVLELEYDKMTKDNSYAQFSPESTGYARVDTMSGTFLVSMTKLSPYADGYKVMLNIGNPNLASYHRLIVKASWGKRYDWKNTSLSFQDWQSGLRSNEVTIPSEIQPGSWNPSSIVLSPADKTEVGYIKVELLPNTVSLRKH